MATIEAKNSTEQFGASRRSAAGLIGIEQQGWPTAVYVQIPHREGGFDVLTAKVVKLSPWLFSTATGTPYSQRNVARDMKRVLRRAKLPLHFSLHCLRHTYAAQRIAAGENVYYVSRQLGHASTKLTLDTYGRWLPARSTTAPPNAVCDRSGDQTVTETVTADACSVGERA